jgi:hypothetical protein
LTKISKSGDGGGSGGSFANRVESKIPAYPIKIDAGNWTAVTGFLPGNITMVTVAYYEDGRIA